MKKLFLATAAIALTATPALAASTASDSFTVNATVQPECSIENPVDVNFGNLAINQDAGADALTLSNTFNNNSQNVWTSCNYAASITIASQNKGLLNPEANDGPDAADFTNIIRYNTHLGSQSGGGFARASLIGGNATATKTQTDAFHEDAELRVVFNANGLRPLAGTYTDTITITLGSV